MKNKKVLLAISFLLIIGLTCIISVFAHSGRTDANGGHWDRSTGTYHYHTGENAGQSSSSSSSSTKTYRAGYNTGYDEGYEKGHTDGYYEGYDKGVADGYDKQTVTLGIATLLFILVVIVFIKLLKFLKSRRKE